MRERTFFGVCLSVCMCERGNNFSLIAFALFGDTIDGSILHTSSAGSTC